MLDSIYDLPVVYYYDADESEDDQSFLLSLYIPGIILSNIFSSHRGFIHHIKEKLEVVGVNEELLSVYWTKSEITLLSQYFGFSNKTQHMTGHNLSILLFANDNDLLHSKFNRQFKEALPSRTSLNASRFKYVIPLPYTKTINNE